jgi:hypothetical protein
VLSLVSGCNQGGGSPGSGLPEGWPDANVKLIPGATVAKVRGMSLMGSENGYSVSSEYLYAVGFRYTGSWEDLVKFYDSTLTDAGYIGDYETDREKIYWKEDRSLNLEILRDTRNPDEYIMRIIVEPDER